MSRRLNPRSIKTAISYTVEEAADVLNVTVQTVRSWEKNGLQIMKGKRPYLVSGAVLRKFLEIRQQKRKQPLQDDELFCMTCRSPRKPFAGIADYEPKTENNGTLVGICEVCEGLCHRFATPAQVQKSSAYMEITIRGGGKH